MYKKLSVWILLLAVVMPCASENFSQGEFVKQLKNLKSQMQDLSKSSLPGSKYISTYDLKALLRDRDPEVRKMAVKNSKTLIRNSSIYNLVLAIYQDERERLDIRIEAARALSYVAGASRVVDKLTYAVRYENYPASLKIMTYKALWSAAASRSATQKFLVWRLKYGEKTPEMKRAVIWSLFASSLNSRVYTALLDILNYGKDAKDVKIECIKSLYKTVGNSKVKRVVLDIARYGKDKEIRKTAIFALSGVNGDSRVKRFLESLLKYSDDNEIKETALAALVGDKFKINKFFHLSYKLEDGSFFNPIENE